MAHRYEYDAFGNRRGEANAGTQTTDGVDTDPNPFRYCGEYFDSSSGEYYLRNRTYNPANGRFSTEDPVQSNTNWYNYCDSNPIGYVDPTGLWEIANIFNWFEEQVDELTGYVKDQFYEKTKSGELDWFLNLSLGAQKDEQGIYHLSQSWWQSVDIVGYNDFYDYVFDAATDMQPEKSRFKIDDQKFIIWAWKGDYTNLGAGAELGIYHDPIEIGGMEHYMTGTEYALPMTLQLYHQGEMVYNWDPSQHEGFEDNTWWITGFNPQLQDVKAEELLAIATMDFSISDLHQQMFWALYNLYRYDPMWQFNLDTHHATFTW